MNQTETMGVTAMAETSEISWTDATFNPWIGCTKVSPACKHCYAERDFDHRYGKVKWGPQGTRVLTSDANWRKPLKWNREAEESGVRKRVFCASLADVFENWKGEMHRHDGSVASGHVSGVMEMREARHRLFHLIDLTPHLDWLLLTKRPESIRWMMSSYNWNRWPVSNLWLGTSVENQEYADERIPELAKCRDLAPVLFLSCEPLLGPVDLDFACVRRDISCIDWVIAGGESGPGARPTKVSWVRSLRDQCDASGVPFHFKQWGDWWPTSQGCGDECDLTKQITRLEDGEEFVRLGKKKAGRILDGETFGEFPEVDHGSLERRNLT